ncbi:MAG: zinc-ribbon domain-containing protein [Candidatus Methanomethylophilus sp.]|jgi:uncharacterized membrane protein YvbJ|nr:zinc-ribbon domain-containing protein [Methanomethylophilus sp.]MCI2074157.1 zinc-ribbon domain-containing protein [Methanomethylophilus sp.]MCI2093046.1 zinc-ribbon domain-containing protein [Methanomethylophilus sp.]
MYCPRCGKENPDGSSFCNACGSPIVGGSAKAADKPAGDSDKSSGNIIGSVASLISAVAALAVVAIIVFTWISVLSEW